MALSRDGYSWTALNNDCPIVNGDSIAQQRGIRDPYSARTVNSAPLAKSRPFCEERAVKRR